MLLLGEGKFFLLLNALFPATFFCGLAFFFPQPSGSTQTNQHSLPASLLIYTGLILGAANTLCLLFVSAWGTWLIDRYTALGLQG